MKMGESFEIATPADPELNEYLAIKVMGWHKGARIGGDAWLDNMNSCVYLCDEFWDKSWHPCESLDQMHLVEERIIELGQRAWGLYESFLSVYTNSMSVHATARQKAEAAYKVFEEVNNG